MQLLTIQRILGILLSLFSITMLPPVLVSWYYQDGASSAFLTAFVLLLIIGLLFWLTVRTVSLTQLTGAGGGCWGSLRWSRGG